MIPPRGRRGKEAVLDTPSPSTDSWSHSQLYTLRVWHEAANGDEREMRMQVKHVLTGETRYFREWAVLIAYVEEKLGSFVASAPPSHPF